MIGILGAGQLGRMLALAGYPLGLRFRVFDPSPAAPASHVAEQVVGEYQDEQALARFASGLTLVTYEFESVPVAAAQALAAQVPVYPPPQALAVAQERLAEKRFFRALGIPTAPFLPVMTRAELEAGVASIGLPAVLKTCRLGYDGKGQAVLRTPDELDDAWQHLAGTELILEGFVEFDRELSILAVRGRDGTHACYPLVENYHQGGILRRSLAPAPGVTPALQAQAEDYAVRVLDALGYVGVLAIELFQAEGTLLANEMAPRVHNSGHWTIEGARTSQFENHVRAVLGVPLGDTTPAGHCAMLNLIGSLPDLAALLAIPGLHLHLYGKQPRRGRKLGHVTLVEADADQVLQRCRAVEQLLAG